MAARRRRIDTLIKPYRITDGRGFRLKQIDPRDTQGLKKEKAQELLQRGIQRLAAMQDKLYAQDQWGVLLVFQAMDAAGKDGAIKHVMSGINPQGCQVYSFKNPSSEELDHDFLWRTTKALPERGRIGIFNRSYYEEVLVVRVHQAILQRQKLPKRLVTKKIWKERFEDICAFESYMARQGYIILKFFLNVSKKEQKERFLERLDRPEKNWKFSKADVEERRHWGDYQRAYQDLIRDTAAPHAPWYVVPADRKWFTRLVVAAAIHDALDRLNLAKSVLLREKAALPRGIRREHKLRFYTLSGTIITTEKNTAETNADMAGGQSSRFVELLQAIRDLKPTAPATRLGAGVEAVLIGMNLDSQHGRKGMIKIGGRHLTQEEVNKIALIAPDATLNIIEDYRVVEKRDVHLPDTIEGTLKCFNPNCITNDQAITNRFDVVNRDPIRIRCHYCERQMGLGDVKLL